MWQVHKIVHAEMCHTNCRVRLHLTGTLVKDFSPVRRDPLGMAMNGLFKSFWVILFSPFSLLMFALCPRLMSHEEERQLSSHIKKWCLHLINTAGPRQQVERKQLTFPTCLSLYFTYNLIWIWIQYRRKVNIAWHLSAISQDRKHIKCRTFVKRWLSKLSIFATSFKKEKNHGFKVNGRSSSLNKHIWSQLSALWMVSIFFVGSGHSA